MYKVRWFSWLSVVNEPSFKVQCQLPASESVNQLNGFHAAVPPPGPGRLGRSASWWRWWRRWLWPRWGACQLVRVPWFFWCKFHANVHTCSWCFQDFSRHNYITKPFKIPSYSYSSSMNPPLPNNSDTHLQISGLWWWLPRKRSLCAKRIRRIGNGNMAAKRKASEKLNFGAGKPRVRSQLRTTMFLASMWRVLKWKMEKRFSWGSSSMALC